MGLCWKSINLYVLVSKVLFICMWVKICVEPESPSMSICFGAPTSKQDKFNNYSQGHNQIPKVCGGVAWWIDAPCSLVMQYLWVSQYLTCLYAASRRWDIPHLFKQAYECYFHCSVEIYQHRCSYMGSCMLI